MMDVQERKSPIANKLALVCALAMAAGTFASDVSLGDASGKPSAMYKTLDSIQEADALAKIPVLLEMAEWMTMFFDGAYRSMLANSIPEELMQNHPFAMVAEILGRALSEIKSLRGTGDLGPDGDKLIFTIAEARYKADRNANLIRQMTIEPCVFESSIDRNGLISMAKLARRADIASNA